MAKHEYRILSRNTQGGLATVVKEFLDAGCWQLVGGVFVLKSVEKTGVEMVPDTHYTQSTFKETLTFYQAILHVRYPSPLDKKMAVNEAFEPVDLYSEN